MESMMTLVTDDRVTGCKTALVFEGDDLIIHRTQDVTAIEEHNAAHRATLRQNAKCAPDGELAGTIPLEIVSLLQKSGVWYDDDALLEWLELPENKAWKMHPARFA